jgi:VIT1/CCC1 family predicted Fe2+/Mn2+ transporter
MPGVKHRTKHIGWLRAAVLGANDGILSTASLVLGVAASHGTHASIMVAGVAGSLAGAMSMAAGEYVSVHSQADIEKARNTKRIGRASMRNWPPFMWGVGSILLSRNRSRIS